MKKYLILLIAVAFLGCLAFSETAQARPPSSRSSRRGRGSMTRKFKREAERQLRESSNTIKKELNWNNIDKAKELLEELKKNKKIPQEAIEVLEEEIKAKETVLEEWEKNPIKDENAPQKKSYPS